MSKNRQLIGWTFAVALVATAALVFMGISRSRTRGVGEDGAVATNDWRPPKMGARGNEQAAIGANEERSADYTPDIEKAIQRAYPAEDVPMEATLGAQAAWAALQAAGGHSPGVWQLIGPSKATYPAVLNVLGDGDQYVTAGRVSAMAIGPTCTSQNCRLYVAAAGGGIWRTTKALSGNPGWQFISGSFASNAMGCLTIDPNDPSGNTIYAGTGEFHASGDSEAGMGIYKSTNGGDTWTLLPGSAIFQGRAVSGIAIQPDGTILAGIARAVRGISSVAGGAGSNPPGGVPFGVWKSTDGGASFGAGPIWNGAGSVRGVNHIELDPHNPSAVMYAAAYQVGVYRSLNNGVTWTQIKTPLNPGANTDRAEFAVAKLASGQTRMYVGVGNQQAPAARFYRTDDAAGAALFADMTTSQVVDYCTGQCWYDNVVFSPKGHPDIVYVGGSYDYNQNGAGVSNARGWLLSTDGGATWSDVTKDGDPNKAEAIHPDQHAIVVHPNDPLQFWTGSDGGVVRSEGGFTSVAYKCAQRGLTGANLAYCEGLLWRVPRNLVSLNEGFSTLQYQSLSVSAQRPQNNFQGGTQDNGTFQYTGSNVVAWQEMYGDGGLSGYSSADDSLRINTFFGQANDVNFRNGDPTKWCVATGPIVSSPESSFFYPPVTTDPNPINGGTIFQGSFSVWRTQDWAGPREHLEANCPEFTTSAANPACGDFVPIGPAGGTDLGSAFYGADRAGSAVAAIERAPQNTGALWAGTGTGRIFVSDNSNAAAGAVVWTRIDSLAATDPGRFPTSIYVDPSNPHHAWISYSGYNINTPAQPGHVFDVTWNGGGAATWTDISHNLADLPITDLVRDDLTGDLYAASDFGVMRLANGSTTWTVAGTGLPQVEVPGLTIVPSARLLYAATHGRSAWKLDLP
jgi:hypothetical protein